MQAKEVKRIAGHRPFRPFGVRLSNGSEYVFNEPHQFGGPQDFRTIFYFGVDDWALIDVENIVEIFQPNGSE